MEFNYARNIPNLQEPWCHTKRIVLPLRLTPHTHRIFCRFGVCPNYTEHVVGKHRTKTHVVFIVRNRNIGYLPKWPTQ